MTIRRIPAFVLALLLAMPALAASATAQFGGLAELEQSLRLNPEQKAQFDVAVSATQRAMLSVGLSALQMKSRLGAELLKDRPDPGVLAEAQEQLIERNRPLFREVRVEWGKLYALMDDDQVRTARAYIDKRLERLEFLGETLRGYLSGK